MCRPFPASARHTHPLVLLFGPRSFDELGVENLLPPVLALHICAILAGQSTKERQRHVLVQIKDEKVVQRRCVWRQVRPLTRCLCSLSSDHLLLVSLQLVSSLLIREAPQVSSTFRPGNRKVHFQKEPATHLEGLIVWETFCAAPRCALQYPHLFSCPPCFAEVSFPRLGHRSVVVMFVHLSLLLILLAAVNTGPARRKRERRFR